MMLQIKTPEEVSEVTIALLNRLLVLRKVKEWESDLYVSEAVRALEAVLRRLYAPPQGRAPRPHDTPGKPQRTRTRRTRRN